MAYNSYLYIVIFLGFTLLLYYVTPRKFRWIILLLASYIFYYISGQQLILYLLGSTVTIYLSGILLGKIIGTYESKKSELSKDEKKAYSDRITRQKKIVVFAALFINLGLLIFLKYYNFIGNDFNFLLKLLNIKLSLPVLKIILPLGISFYTLQAVSYVIDVYRGKCKADRNFGRVALFLSFFPQIVEGPIGRYGELAHQLYEGHRFDFKNFTFGGQLIIWGLFKKVVIADRASMLVKTVFGSPSNYSGIAVLLAILLYTLQIYAEFSGAMDIVTGSAQMFGVRLSKNFERPFFSKSVAEFWRRWHITLGTWLRDYILYSASLSKWFIKLSKKLKKHLSPYFGKMLPTLLPLLFVWLACGLWHGASWKFIGYGMYYYAIMALGMLFEPLFAKAFGHLKINRERKAYRLMQIIRTLILVNIGMLIFRAPLLSTAYSMLHSVFTGFSVKALTNGSLLKLGLDVFDFYVLGLGAVLIFVVGFIQEKGIGLREAIADRNIALRWCVYFAAIFSVIIFGAYGAGYNPVDFIYAQF